MVDMLNCDFLSSGVQRLAWRGVSSMIVGVYGELTFFLINDIWSQCLQPLCMFGSLFSFSGFVLKSSSLIGKKFGLYT